MPKICFIGSSTLKKEYEDALILHGHTITKFKSLDTALPKLNKKADLLIIDKEQNIEPSFKELLKLTKNIPKILILDSSWYQAVSISRVISSSAFKGSACLRMLLPITR